PPGPRRFGYRGNPVHAGPRQEPAERDDRLPQRGTPRTEGAMGSCDPILVSGDRHEVEFRESLAGEGEDPAGPRSSERGPGMFRQGEVVRRGRRRGRGGKGPCPRGPGQPRTRQRRAPPGGTPRPEEPDGPRGPQVNGRVAGRRAGTWTGPCCPGTSSPRAGRGTGAGARGGLPFPVEGLRRN